MYELHLIQDDETTSCWHYNLKQPALKKANCSKNWVLIKTSGGIYNILLSDLKINDKIIDSISFKINKTFENFN